MVVPLSMEQYSKSLEIRWSDLDPNFHVLHSKYYDFGAYCRMSFFVENGITPELLNKHHIGLIILREECIFRKEIRFADAISINLFMSKASGDYKRWTLNHEIYKNGDTLAAIITLDGAWMDTLSRKMAIPPQEFGSCFETIPKTADYVFTP